MHNDYSIYFDRACVQAPDRNGVAWSFFGLLDVTKVFETFDGRPLAERVNAVLSCNSADAKKLIEKSKIKIDVEAYSFSGEGIVVKIANTSSGSSEVELIWKETK